MGRNATTFQKGHKAVSGGVNSQLRRDLTIELITQLNQMDHFNKLSRPQREVLHNIVQNLILHANGVDVYNKKTKSWTRDKGDLQAILAIFDRLEGRPSQAITGPNNGPVQHEFKTAEEVRVYLIQRGFDLERLPPPNLQIERK
jgi:hypothetical protein